MGRMSWKKRSMLEGNFKAYDPAEMDKSRAEELGKCFANAAYFIDNYCKIYDSISSDWVPFKLWDCQKQLVSQIHYQQLTVILKARQLGISWISLAYALWSIMFRPIASVSVFSRREPEAIYLLGPERLRGMYNNLPLWMKTGITTVTDNGKEWILSTGSVARAFPTSAGDGYVSTLAIVDEADLTPDLNQLMRSVKPTIEMGGKLILLSRVNKSEPESEFKSIYRGARSGENGWFPVFLPWYAHPNRDKDWYERQRKDIYSRTGSYDDLYEQYPETDTQALSARTLDKRIPPHWIEACYQEIKPIFDRNSPTVPKLVIYKKPEVGVRYVLGADPAEGNPTSDDSALTVISQEDGEEVAIMVGKYEPAIFASYIAQVCTYYNACPVMVERNNHGHSVIQWLEEHARRVRLLPGHDAEAHKTGKKARQAKKRKKAGWLSSTLGKAILYTVAADFFREAADLEGGNPKQVVHSFSTVTQLCSIEAATLRAPDGQADDRADSFALAQAGRAQLISLGKGSVLVMAGTSGWGW